MDFVGFCDDAGHFALDNREAFLTYVAKFKGQELIVSVEPRKRTRSLDQNAYWWAVPVKILAEELGYTPTQMHYALLGECFGYKAGPTGQPVPNKPSSSELTVEEFTHLIDWVRVWAPSELEIVIPEPNETTP